MSKIPEMSREHLAGNREFAAERMKMVHRLETIIRIHRTACLHAHTCFNNNDISAGDFQRFETHYEEALDRLRNVDKNQCCKCERWSDETSEQDGRMICHGCFQDEKYEEEEKNPSIEEIEEIFGPNRPDFHRPPPRHSTPSIEDFEAAFGPNRSDFRRPLPRHSTPSIEDFEAISGSDKTGFRPDIPTENRGSNLADPILIDSD